MGVSHAFCDAAAENDMKKAHHYWELGDKGGYGVYNLSCDEYIAGNYERAYTHELRAAKAGDQDVMETIKDGYIEGYVTKEEYK